MYKCEISDEVDVTMETAATNLQETLDSGRTSGHARKAKQVPREWGECLFEDEDLNQVDIREVYIFLRVRIQ